MKRLHLICNAHLDPCWLWELEEGAATPEELVLKCFAIADAVNGAMHGLAQAGGFMTEMPSAPSGKPKKK